MVGKNIGDCVSDAEGRQQLECFLRTIEPAETTDSDEKTSYSWSKHCAYGLQKWSREMMPQVFSSKYPMAPQMHSRWHYGTSQESVFRVSVFIVDWLPGCGQG